MPALLQAFEASKIAQYLAISRLILMIPPIFKFDGSLLLSYLSASINCAICSDWIQEVFSIGLLKINRVTKITRETSPQANFKNPKRKRNR
jgi:hypothetical protein